MWKYEFYKQKKTFRANNFPFSPENQAEFGVCIRISIRHQLKKFGFCESEIIPQVKVLLKKSSKSVKMDYFTSK